MYKRPGRAFDSIIYFCMLRHATPGVHPGPEERKQTWTTIS